jgi:Asp-tRNA(Asn)/Glu-tRNA(Gln) amidotransferase A subunit family amidase
MKTLNLNNQNQNRSKKSQLLDRRDFLGYSLKGSLALATAMASVGCWRNRQLWTYDSHFEEYRSYDAVDLARLVKRGQADPMELLEIAITRAEIFNPKYNFMAAKFYDYARNTLGRNRPTGALAGVPYLLKDLNTHLQDTPMTFGSKFYRDFVSSYDSTLATRYKDAGLIMFGKTTSPEFGSSVTTESTLHGVTRNPWNPELSAGGSSGGSAVAVALGVVPAAHASDGGGSIRIPASACGLFGLKPTRGRVPYGPVVMEATGGLTCVHAVSRTVRDSAALLDISHGAEAGAHYVVPTPKIPYLAEVKRSPGKLKIGVVNGEGSGIKVDEDCLKALEHARLLCQELGHNTASVKWPEGATNKDYGDTMGILMGSERVYAISATERAIGRGVREDELEAVNWYMLKHMRGLNSSVYLHAKRTMVRVTQAMHEHYKDYDVILSPTMGALPPKLDTLDANKAVEAIAAKVLPYAAFTAPYNVSGQPAMSVPLYWNKDNLPVGVMFAAQKYEENLLYRLAAQLEESAPWIHRRAV